MNLHELQQKYGDSICDDLNDIIEESFQAGRKSAEKQFERILNHFYVYPNEQGGYDQDPSFNQIIEEMRGELHNPGIDPTNPAERI